MHQEKSINGPHKVVIIGGVAGGMSAAARARRLSEITEIVVFEKTGFVSFANCGLPYYLGREIQQESNLILQTSASLKERFNLDVRIHNEVIEIDPEKKLVKVKNLITGQCYDETYDDLILAVGAVPIKPDVPGAELEGLFTLRTIEDVQAIERWIEQHKPKTVVIAGGGFIGLEMAEQFVRRGLDVTLIDSSEQVLAPLDAEMASLVQNELRRHGIKLVLGSLVKQFSEPSTYSGAQPKSCWVSAGVNAPIPADFVILGLGIRPDLTLARKTGLQIGERGGITVNAQMQTNLDNIWAVGDAIEVRHPISQKYTRIALGGPANRQGRLVADNIFGANETYNGTLGTAILRVFELTAGMTGLNEKDVKQANIPYEAVRLHPSNHAGYFPGAERLDMKLLFHKSTGELLGAQVVGKAGADKRLDILATALKARMTASDLAELELAYAPPFGSAKDPINLAGMIGRNLLENMFQQVDPSEISGSSQHCLLDVRSKAEREKGCIPGSLHIPLPQLRKQLSELAKDTPIIVYCQSGQRSYYASRFLRQNGYQVRSLSGGYLSWEARAAGSDRSPGLACR